MLPLIGRKLYADNEYLALGYLYKKVYHPILPTSHLHFWILALVQHAIVKEDLQM